MKFDTPIVEFDEEGRLKRLAVGTCDTCGNEIDNSKQSFIEYEGKIYHIECFTLG